MSDISEQGPSNTIEDLKKALSSEVGKAERGSKICTKSIEKEERCANKSRFCKINAEDDLKTTI